MRRPEHYCVIIAATLACRAPDRIPDESNVPAASDAAPPSQISPSASASARPSDSLGSIYPDEVAAHPLATRLCEALHLVAGRRVAACCGGEPRRYLFEPARVDACETSASLAFAGCDWVTPSQPGAPAPCQDQLRGTLLEGAVCRSSLECAGTHHCEGLGPTRTGVCQPPEPLGSGCGVQVDVLATYTLQTDVERSHPFCAAFCSLTSHRCEPSPQPGAPCFASINCAPGQTCAAGACRLSNDAAVAAPAAHHGPECAITWPSSSSVQPGGQAPPAMRLPTRPLQGPKR